MNYSDFKNHRNVGYMAWLRTQNCVVTDSKAECAHHIRLGTNGGSSLKPSDYFCIPLENEFHTQGELAVHMIGEESFLNHFNLNKEDLFFKYLKGFLLETYQIAIDFEKESILEKISILVNEIEARRPAKKVRKKTQTKKEKSSDSTKKSAKGLKPSFKGDPYYEKAKELKRVRDKELRDSMKSNQPSSTQSAESIDYYAKLKEEQKIKARNYRKEQYRKLKEFKSK